MALAVKNILIWCAEDVFALMSSVRVEPYQSAGFVLAHLGNAEYLDQLQGAPTGLEVAGMW